jgi:ATP-binding cassette subfamily B protein
MNKNNKLLKSIFLLFRALDSKRKYQFVGILIINILNGLFEFVSLGSALLFLESLTNTSQISSSFSYLINTFNINNDSDLIRLSTTIFLGITFLTTLIRIFNLWLNTKFRISFLNYISNKIYRKIINQEYTFFLNKNSSELLTDLTSNIEKTNFFFENLLTLTTALILSISIVLSLLKLNFYITIFSVVFFSILYTIIGIFINKKVDKFSKSELQASYSLTRIIQDSLNAIKEIIVSNSHSFYSSKFKTSNYKLRRYQGMTGFITTFPRYLFEGIGLLFIGISGIVIYSTVNNSSNVIALLGAFALGAQKLLPTMQSSYKSWSLLYFYNKPLDRILDLITLNSNENTSIKGKLLFNNEIKIRNLNFSYSNDQENISKDINLTIKKGETIGIFGKTGSGKTTLVNIFMGLLTPKKGSILIDDMELFNRGKNYLKSKWKNNIALVPQDVFLYDSSIIENIAFCTPRNKIDVKKALEAAKISHADEFIRKTTNGYETIVGDKGIKLSGGQKQRLGLSRAFYSDCDILILDESTSALDFKTEKAVMDSIFNRKSNRKLTTLMIAHRLFTLRYCDRIIELNNGEIKKIYDNKEFLKKYQDLF